MDRNLFDLFRLLGHISGKILQGAKPGDLPIERPTKFELVLNMRTEKRWASRLGRDC